ncbi:ABC transporter ATP-binding protein [Sedimentibacter sp.]|uniref:ABC transporter ATP-binding protein n=1 Tax=Sedimentibacter sp. TaxID=1960295 RepID=UPI0028AC506A|nr:ABC transporter ATP-binding protein [Sedimentibacter sp.]
MISIKEDLKLLKNLKKYFLLSIRKIIIIEILVLINIAVQIVHPILWGKIVVALFDRNINDFYLYLSYIVIAILINMIVDFCEKYLRQKLNESIVLEVKKDMYSKVLGLSIGNITKLSNGELFNRLEKDTSTVANGMIEIIFSISTNLIKIIIVGIVMIRMNLYLASIILTGTPFIAFVVSKFGKKIRKLNEENLKVHDKYYGFVQQIVGGMFEIKAMRIYKNIIEKYRNLTKNVYDSNMKMALYNNGYSSFGDIFNLIMDISILLVGGIMILNGTLAYEYFIAFTSYEKQFSNAYMNILNINIRLQTMLTSIERMYNSFDDNDYLFIPRNDISDIEGTIKFNNVNFSYNGTDDILKNINFAIKPNTITGIVGRNGCGKTTTINLMLGLYYVDEGKVTLDGVDIKYISEEVLKKCIFPSIQNSFLFNTSIKDNLLLVKPDATSDEIVYACRKAGIHEYIISLKEGYDTVIGENGAELSGGQRQKLVLSRSILSNSKIMIFDEITSSIDFETTKKIKEIFYELSDEHTIIIISHDESMFDIYDQILFMDAGEIIRTEVRDKAV